MISIFCVEYYVTSDRLKNVFDTSLLCILIVRYMTFKTCQKITVTGVYIKLLKIYNQFVLSAVHCKSIPCLRFDVFFRSKLCKPKLGTIGMGVGDPLVRFPLCFFAGVDRAAPYFSVVLRTIF